ncbi:MAG: hypothetical protein ACT443_03250 [Gemmatimonadota bacterium]
MDLWNLFLKRVLRIPSALRRTLAAARAYFVEQLDQKRPALEDAWFPYLLAFGLGKDMVAARRVAAVAVAGERERSVPIATALNTRPKFIASPECNVRMF